MTATVPAGALAGATAPNSSASGPLPVTAYTAAATTAKAASDSARMIARMPRPSCRSPWRFSSEPMTKATSPRAMCVTNSIAPRLLPGASASSNRPSTEGPSSTPSTMKPISDGRRTRRARPPK